MKHLFFILMLFSSFAAWAQQGSITGSITDEKNLPLTAAIVSISDRQAEKYHVLSNKEGAFIIQGVGPGFYYIRVSYLGKEAYEDSLQVYGSAVSTGTITLAPSANMLPEANIRDKARAVGQKDDTLEFNASAYLVHPDADGVDLVRKMPAIDISGSTVTAQGETVIKVLLDGKPFFGTDAYATLKNLPADIIDKVQVYNEKNDQEQFTGFSEGSTSKTINIITKPDRRNGIFGNVYAGYGTDNTGEGKYGAGSTMNTFKGDQRITLTAQANNVSVQNFTDPNNSRGSGGGGLTTTNAGGINYSDKWGRSTDVSGSYFFNETNNNSVSSLDRTYILPQDSTQASLPYRQVYNQTSIASHKNYGHRFNLRLNYTIDTLNSLLWTPAFSWNTNKGSAEQQGITTEGAMPLNQTINNSLSAGTGYNISSNLLFRHKFHKKGRTFFANLNTGNTNNSGDPLRTAQNTYYNSPALSDTLNQLIHNGQNTWNITGNATYTEPAGSYGLIKLEYNISSMPAHAENNTYNYSYATGQYSVPDSLYSSSFYSRNTIQKAGGSYQYSRGRYELSAGIYYQLSRLSNNQSLPVHDITDRGFENLLPTATARYKFSKTSNLQLTYNTNTQAPSVSQMQNVVNNLNPLFLTTGNPLLKQPYRHNLSLRYNAMDKASKRLFSASITGNYTQNAIAANNINAANDTFIAAEHVLLPKGSQLTIPVNLDGNNSVTGNMNYGMPLTSIKCNLKLSVDAGLSSIPAMINNVINIQHNRTGSAGITISSNINENIDFLISSNTGVVATGNSLNVQLNTTYVTENTTAALNLIFWKGFVFHTNISYRATTGSSAGYNQGSMLWNMSIGKKIFKKQQGEIMFSAFDLLNDNNNIQHTVTDTYIQDTRGNIVQRYFLAVFTYKIRDFRSSSK